MSALRSSVFRSRISKQMITTGLSALCLGLVSLPGHTAEPAKLPNPYQQIQHWGELPGGRDWGNVSAVAIGPEREAAWVAERCGANSCIGSDIDAVMRFDAEGNLQQSFGEGLFSRPHGMTVDAQGNIWVADDQGLNREQFPLSARSVTG